MDPFASHPLRALLALLMPNLFPAEQRASTLRSKKSAAYKARQGPMKSVFSDSQAKSSRVSLDTPKEFREVAGKFVGVLRENLSANEVRALAASQVASPVLQVCLPLGVALTVADSSERCCWKSKPIKAARTSLSHFQIASLTASSHNNVSALSALCPSLDAFTCSREQSGVV